MKESDRNVSYRKPNQHLLQMPLIVLSWYSGKIAAGIVRNLAATRQDALFPLMKLAVSEIGKIGRKKTKVEALPRQVVQKELNLLLGVFLKQTKKQTCNLWTATYLEWKGILGRR